MTTTTDPNQPVGTPPAGGRWTWDGTQWVQLPEDNNAPAPAQE